MAKQGADVLRQVAELEDEAAQVMSATEVAVAPLKKQLAAEVKALSARRYELVTGRAPPEASELEGLAESDPEAAAAHASGGCPTFWVSALSNCDVVSESITARDVGALAWLRDVRPVEGLGEAARGVELVFDVKNPYFRTKVLRRIVGGGADAGTEIDWLPGMNLTVKAVTKKSKRGKKGKKGGGGGGGDEDAGPARTRYRPCPSFFRLFALPEDGSGGGDDDSDGEADAKGERDAEVVGALLSDVALRATHLFMQGPLRPAGAGGGAGASDSDSDDEPADLPPPASVDDLPPATRAVVAALRSVQSKLDDATARHTAERRKAGGEAAAKVKALLRRRRDLLATAMASGSAPPCFWLRVLRRCDAAALAVTPRDAAVLQHLADVRWELALGPGGGGGGGSGGGSDGKLHGLLELEFSEACPQLAGGGKTLAKAYVFEARAGTAGPLRLVSARVTAPPQWAPGIIDPTHRRTRDGRVRPCASFFHLFRAGGGGGKLAFNLVGPEREVQPEANALEVEMLAELGQAVGAAAKEYAAAPRNDGIAAEGDEGGSSEEEEEEEEGDDDGEGGSGEAAAARRAALRSGREAKQAWKLPRGSLLCVLLGLVLVGQYLALFVHLTGN